MGQEATGQVKEKNVSAVLVLCLPVRSHSTQAVFVQC